MGSRHEGRRHEGQDERKRDREVRSHDGRRIHTIGTHEGAAAHVGSCHPSSRGGREEGAQRTQGSRRMGTDACGGAAAAAMRRMRTRRGADDHTQTQCKASQTSFGDRQEEGTYRSGIGNRR